MRICYIVKFLGNATKLHSQSKRLKTRHQGRPADSDSVMNQYLEAAIEAARAAGALVRENFGRPLKVNVEEAHDLKLELYVCSQALITKLLLEKFPNHAIIGEEGDAENDSTEFEWVIAAIDW